MWRTGPPSCSIGRECSAGDKQVTGSSAWPIKAASAVAAERGPRRSQPVVVGPAGALLLGGTFWLAAGYGLRQAALFLVGAGCGLVLYHSLFGFTTAFRVLVTSGDTRGLRAQLWMFAVATLLFAPMLATGQGFGAAAGGAVAPVGVSVAVGAFVFAIGMQLGGG